jgi:glycosyltransferase involved in cell wall biosynthesis
MALESTDYRLGIILGDPVAFDAQGRLSAAPGIGVLMNELRARLPSARLCVPIVPVCTPLMNHPLDFAPEEIVRLPPLESVARSQRHFFRTRRVVRSFAAERDVLFVRVPFQIPMAIVGLPKPKLMHVVANAHSIIASSINYRGPMRLLAMRYAAHMNATFRRIAQEPMTRVATNGGEMWKLLNCREGRVVVSSCIHQRDMRPREDQELGDPPRLLFVGYLRPEKGIANLLEAFEIVRRKRPLKLTIVGATDNGTDVEELFLNRIRTSEFRDDVTLAGLLPFGEPLFDAYRQHDLLVLPSLSEGTPRTLVEARGFGCPVVATRVGGIPSSVDDGRTGLLVEPNDSPGLAAAIERVLDDDALRRSLIREGLQESHRYSVEYFAGQLIEELDILAAQFVPQRSSPAKLVAERR